MQTLTTLTLAFLGYSVMNISQAGQKIGLEKKGDRQVAGWSLWIGATIGTLLGVVIVLVALSIGAVSLVGAMAGTGLVALAIFSHFAMGEKITWSDVVGIATIIGASVLIGIFAQEQQDPDPRWIVIHGLTGALIAVYIVLWIVAGKSDRAGLVLGGFGGTLAGTSMLYQNGATVTADIGPLIEFPLRESLTLDRLAALANPYLFIWFALSVGAFSVLQIAYGRGKAIHVIPAFNVHFIVIPVIGGVVGFAEAMHPLQWLGVAIIVAGTVFLTAKPGPIATESSSES